MSENKGPDPGWNDPPTFSYDKATEIQANAVKKGTLLNKRVPFPLSGPSRASTGGIDPTIPPAPVDLGRIGAPPIGPPPVSMSPKLPPTLPLAYPPGNVGSPPVSMSPKIPPTLPPANTPGIIEDVHDRLKDVLNNFETIHKLDQGDEISKRIKMMEKMWSDGKLDLVVQKRLLDLSEVLKQGDIPAADRIQKSLMVDHVTVCSTWMVGVRQLINMRRGDEDQAS